MNSVLLDTHTLIWMVSEERQLGSHASDVLFDSDVTKLLSPASYWEMAIKIKSGKLELNAGYDDFFREAIEDYGLAILHILPQHTSFLTTLDLFHKDPFDRLLIAQASVESIPIISIDRMFDVYPVIRLWEYEQLEGDDNEESEEAQSEY